MAGAMLPPVVTTLTGDIEPLLASIAKAKAAMDGLRDQKVVVKVTVDDSQLAKAALAIQALSDKQIKVGVNTSQIREGAAAVNGLGKALDSADASMNRINRSSNTVGGRRLPGWIGVLTSNPDVLHASAIALMAIGAAAAGAAVGVGALAAAWSKGAMPIALSDLARYQTGSIQGQSVGQTFGVQANPAMQQAQAIGFGQMLGLQGGAVSYLNSHQSSLLANEGTSIGNYLDSTMARLDQTSQGTGFQTFLKTVNTDAINLGSSLGNVAVLVGKIVSHSPGEIEWLTTGLNDATGAATSLLSSKALSGVLSAAMILHSAGALSGIAGYALKGLGNTAVADSIPGLSKLTSTTAIKGMGLSEEEALAAGMLPINMHSAGGNTTSILKALGLIGEDATISTPMVGAALAAGLTAARLSTINNYHIPGTPITVHSQLQNISGQQSALKSMGIQQIGGAITSDLGQNLGYIGAHSNLTNMNPVEKALSWLGSPSDKSDVVRWLFESSGSSALTQASQLSNAFKTYGKDVNFLSGATGGNVNQAMYLAQQAGITMGINNGKLTFTQGKNQISQATAMQQLKNLESAYAGYQGTSGEASANIGVSQLMNSSSVKNAASLNSTWDAYNNVLSGGGSALSSLYAALGKVPKGMTASLTNTSAAIQSAGEPMMDWLRNAQSMGAIGGKGLSTDFAAMAASMEPLAGKSKSAQAALLALANEGGGNFKNMSQVMAAAGGSAQAALKKLDNSVSGVTTNLARLTPGMKTFANQVTNDISAMAASAVAKIPSVNKAFNSMMSAMEKTGTSSKQTQTAAENLFNQLVTKGKLTASEANTFMASIDTAWKKVPQGQTKSNYVNTYATTFDKTIVEQLVNSPMTQGSQGKGHAQGTPAAPAGWAWVGEQGPELMQFSGGERVMNHPQSMAVSRGYAGGVGVGGDTHVHVYLDSQEMFGAVKSQVYKYNVRNGNRDGTGRPSGNFRPRG